MIIIIFIIIIRIIIIKVKKIKYFVSVNNNNLYKNHD